MLLFFKSTFWRVGVKEWKFSSKWCDRWWTDDYSHDYNTKYSKSWHVGRNSSHQLLAVDQQVHSGIVAFYFRPAEHYHDAAGHYKNSHRFVDLEIVLPGDPFEPNYYHWDLQCMTEECDCSLDHIRHSSFHDARALKSAWRSAGLLMSVTPKLLSIIRTQKIYMYKSIRIWYMRI